MYAVQVCQSSNCDTAIITQRHTSFLLVNYGKVVIMPKHKLFKIINYARTYNVSVGKLWIIGNYGKVVIMPKL